MSLALRSEAERGASGTGIDRVVLSADVATVRLVVGISNDLRDSDLSADIVGVDSGSTIAVPDAAIDIATPGVSVDVPASLLMSADYILTIRASRAGTSYVLAREPFRVVRPND